MEKKLPKNWVEIELGEILWVKNGFAFKSKEYRSEGIPIIRMSDIIDNKITTNKAARVKPEKQFERYIIDKGDILIGMSGSIGKYGIFDLDETVYLNQRVGNLKLYSYKKINIKLIYYLIGFIQQTMVDSSYGGAVPNISSKQIEQTKFNLPPLPEQQRIVTKLDEVFGHLDILKAKLENIPQLIKNFRQAVLTQAVTGKLTEEWRGSKSVRVDSPITIGDEFQEKPKKWIWSNLIDLAKLESGHTPRKSKEEYWINGDIPWISLQDIRAAHGTIISDTKFKPNMVGINNSSARLLPKGTVCFSRDISVGFTTIMGKKMATTQHFANWICGEKLFNKYLLYALISAKDFLIASGKGTTVKTIYMPALKQFRILLPPREEQTEIVKRVEALFAKADAVATQYQSLKRKIDSLPQAILAKAFKGELVEQLPTDGDAKDLLAQIQQLKSEMKTKGKKRTVKK